MSEYVYHNAIHNFEAPRQVIPIVMGFIKPTSVLDVGCGNGTWLKTFEELGVKDYLGLDGEHVGKEHLKIPLNRFSVQNLTQRWLLHRKFDLVISLEVGEHLPENSADDYVKTLTAHGDVILFSAAIPGQGGQYHINEQWPDYWQEKFLTHGFYFHDVIRPLIWSNEAVNWWYRQNLFLVTKVVSEAKILRQVHPDCFKTNIDIVNNSLRSVVNGEEGLMSAFKILLKSFRNRIGKW